MKSLRVGKVSRYLLLVMMILSLTVTTAANDLEEELAEHFTWWPTDAAPGPVRDEERGGYWWWPTTPGEIRPWGNRGYIYVYRIIFDYRKEELPPPQPKELRPSLLIKRTMKNVKIYFDFDQAKLRDEARPILENAVRVLNRNPESNILITGNTDIRGPEVHNLKLGRGRAETVKEFMLGRGISRERIRILSRGELDAVAPIDDLVGMQKDRNAQFMIADVREIMIPYPEKVTHPERKVVEEIKKIATPIRVNTRERTIQKGDTLWDIAVQEYGDGSQWRRIYNLNKDRIEDPDKLKPGLTIIIPIE